MVKIYANFTLTFILAFLRETKLAKKEKRFFLTPILNELYSYFLLRLCETQIALQVPSEFIFFFVFFFHFSRLFFLPDLSRTLGLYISISDFENLSIWCKEALSLAFWKVLM